MSAATFAEKCSNDARMITLQAMLLDHSGHVHAGLSRARARAMLAEIRKLRAANGFGPLAMAGRWDRPCVLCGETFPADDMNAAGECQECTDAAEAASGF